MNFIESIIDALGLFDDSVPETRTQHASLFSSLKTIPEAAPSVPDYIYFDVETTGLYPDSDELLQLSIIDDFGTVLYDGYFKPTQRTSWPAAQSVNHISPAMVKNAPYFFQERAKIQKIFNDAKIAFGYNVNFDRRFLENNGISFASTKVMDVLPLARKAALFTCDNRLETIATYYHFDYSRYPAHNSLSDVLATKYVLDHLGSKPKEYVIDEYAPACSDTRSIDCLKLNARIKKALRENGINYVCDLQNYPGIELATLKGIGPASLRDIRKALLQYK